MTVKGTNEGGEALVAAKGKDPLFEQEVDSPRIQNLADVVFGVSSSVEEKDERKGAGGGRSLGHEKLGEEPNLVLETDIVHPTHSTREEMDELGFFIRHLPKKC